MTNEELLRRLHNARAEARRAMVDCEGIGALQSARELGAIIDRIKELESIIRTGWEIENESRKFEEAVRCQNECQCILDDTSSTEE
jgi:hypothetical protein